MKLEAPPKLLSAHRAAPAEELEDTVPLPGLEDEAGPDAALPPPPQVE